MMQSGKRRFSALQAATGMADFQQNEIDTKFEVRIHVALWVVVLLNLSNCVLSKRRRV